MAFTTGCVLIPVILSFVKPAWEDLFVHIAQFWGAYLVGYLAGDVLDVYFNRCVPPLIDVWREISRMARLIGGYGLGYLVINLVFAAIFASVHLADTHAFRGVDASGNS